MNNKTEIIAFFSSEGFFRLKSEEKQKARFEDLKEPYEVEFCEPLHDDLLEFLLHYQSEQRNARKEREKSKLLKAASLPISAGVDKADAHIEQLPPGKYVLTACQNNTEVDSDFFKSLLHYCKENDCKLLIAKLTYNKQAFCQPDLNNDLWYAPELKPYIVNGHYALGGKWHFVANANIIPTARNPLRGMESVTGAGINCILPASKIALKVSAALKHTSTKIITSTGVCTKRNYIMRGLGTSAMSEHNIAAIFLDTETDEMRHLEQMPGFDGFSDLHNRYFSEGIIRGENNIEVLQLGDIHAEKMEVENLDKIIILISNLKPKHLCVHDLIDFRTRNHHNLKDPAFLHEQYVNGNTVEKDLKIAAKVLDKLATSCDSLVTHVIESNHDTAINTWLKFTGDFKNDPENAVVYLTCMLALYKHQAKHKNSDFNMLKYAYKEIGRGKLSKEINFHEVDDSLKLAGVEHSCHGHLGINGARSSPASYRLLGIPVNTGHTHSPSIIGHVFTAGVSAGYRLGYNKGMSSWRLAHILTYNNGQRQIIFM